MHQLSCRTPQQQILPSRPATMLVSTAQSVLICCKLLALECTCLCPTMRHSCRPLLVLSCMSRGKAHQAKHRQSGFSCNMQRVASIHKVEAASLELLATPVHAVASTRLQQHDWTRTEVGPGTGHRGRNGKDLRNIMKMICREGCKTHAMDRVARTEHLLMLNRAEVASLRWCCCA